MKVLIKGLAYPCVNEKTPIPHAGHVAMCLTPQQAHQFVGLPVLDEYFDRKLGEIVQVDIDKCFMYVCALLYQPPIHNGLSIYMDIIFPEGIVRPCGVAIVPVPFYIQCIIDSWTPLKIPSHREILAREIGHAKKGQRMQRRSLQKATKSFSLLL